MAVFVRILLALSLACICVCKAGEEGQSHWAVAMGIKHRADRVERKSVDGKDSVKAISTGNRRRRSLSQSDRTDSVTMMNNLRRTIGSSNMPYMAYDVGAENEAATWTYFCNYDTTFNTPPGYVISLKSISQNSVTISTVIRAIFKSYHREISSVYLTSFGCDLYKCNTATSNGKVYRNALLIACLFQGSSFSEYDDNKVQYKLGEACTECNSGSFWCDYGLCRADCTVSDSCYCNSYCMNCADTDRTTCRCECLQGWTGSRCETQSSANATTPICSTTARVPKTLTTINPNSVASIGLSVLQLVFCAMVALILRC